MRIISKFHDYYDSARAFGFDPNIIYVRKTEELKLTSIEQKLLKSSRLNFSPSFNIIYVTVAFCGDIYRGFKLSQYNAKSIIPNNFGYIWSFKKLIKVFPAIVNYFSNRKSIFSLNEQNLKDYFNIETGLQSVIDLHLKYKSPLISFRQTEDLRIGFIKEKDVSLRSIGFQQVMDPYAAFQKLSVFVGNILISQSKEPWPISDKLKAQSKGFDDYSFRRRPRELKL